MLCVHRPHGFALGVARHALDEIAAIGRDKVGLSRRVGDLPDFQIHYARAEAQWRSARLFAYDAIGKAQRVLEAGDKLQTRTITMMRLALLHAIEVASKICIWAHHKARRRGVVARESIAALLP